jgi:hypothetical protein
MSKIHQVIRDIVSIEEQIVSLQALMRTSKQKVQAFMQSRGIEDMMIPVDKESSATEYYHTRIASRLTVKYDVSKLKRVLDKEMQNEVIQKQYAIVDMNTMVALLKRHKVPVDKFKECIHVTESVDSARLKQLYDSNEILMEDIEGCYTATLTKSLSIKRKSADKQT